MLCNDLRNGEVIEIRVEGQGLGQEFLSVPQPGLWGRCYPSLIPLCWGWDGAAAGPGDLSGLAAPSVHPPQRILSDYAAHEDVGAFGTEKRGFLETAWRRTGGNRSRFLALGMGNGCSWAKRRNMCLTFLCAIQKG